MGAALKTALVGALAAAGAAYAVVAQERPAASGPPGYLGGAVPDFAVFIPAPPPIGSPADLADVAAYERTRALQGSPRWELATRDAATGPAAALENFSCAVGLKLDAATAPKLAHLLGRMSEDVRPVMDKGKANYRRPRPFVRIPGPICTDNSAAMADSWSYPSGHTIWGWGVALVLAALDPARATPILARGKAYGDSRVVCGVHYVSDVEAGRTTGAALVSALHADPAFQADLAAARAEFEGLRQRGVAAPDPAQCAATNATAAIPWQ